MGGVDVGRGQWLESSTCVGLYMMMIDIDRALRAATTCNMAQRNIFLRMVRG